MKITGGLLILFLTVLILGGCAELRGVGPCYGVGCPVFSTTRAPAGQPQSASSQPTSAQNAPTAANQQKSAAKKGHGLHSLLHKLKL